MQTLLPQDLTEVAKSSSRDGLSGALARMLDLKGSENAELAGLLSAGYGMKDIFCIEGADIEVLVDFGHRALVAGDFETAEPVFFFLSQLDSLDRRFPFALGSLYQLKGDFFRAWALYSVALTLDATWVDAYLRLAECVIALGDPGRAEVALEMALALIADGHGDGAMVSRAEVLLAGLERVGVDVSDLRKNRE